MAKPEDAGDPALRGRDSGEVTRSGSGSPGFVERRGAQRYLVDADVVFASELQELRGTTCDISVGGACVAAYRLLPVRTPVEVKLSLPQGLVLCRAEIRWVRPARGALGRMGITFIGLSDLDRKLLVKFTDDAVVASGPISSRR